MEQLAVLDASRRNVRRLKIEALAGTGKTSTLIELAKDLKVRRSRQRTLYVAFNNFVVDEVSSKIGRFADAMTVNSLALRMVGRPFQEKLSETPQRMSHRQAADLLGITSELRYSINFNLKDGSRKEVNRLLTREQMAGMVSRAVLRFCQSLDRSINPSYFAEEIFLGPEIGRFPIPDSVKQELTKYAVRYWADIADPNSRRFRFRHEHYMKLWHLMDPVIPYDTILFDEAQDADPLMRDVVERHPGQVVWCGDRYQAIYGWRGAVNAMQDVTVDETLYLTSSFRFDEHVAEIANRFLVPLGSRKVIGAAHHSSRVGQIETPDVEIFRRNTSLIERFMELANANVPVRTDVDLGEYERVVEGLLTLRRNIRPRHPDLAEFVNFSTLTEWLKDPEVEDDEFRLMIRQLLRHNLEDLLAALVKARKSTGESFGRLLTTAHKAKGLGFDRVVVHSDFPVFSFRDSRIEPDDLVYVNSPEKRKSWRGELIKVPRETAPDFYKDFANQDVNLCWRCPPQEEWQLAYVAVTRSIRELSHPFEDVEQVSSREYLDKTFQVVDQNIVVEEPIDITSETTQPHSVDGLRWSESADVTVAGTSYCQQALEKVASLVARNDDGWPCIVRLTCEPDNQFDPNAVLVLIDGVKVGYMPKEFASILHSALGAEWFDVPGIIVGGYLKNGVRASFGLRLYLAWGE
jgi:superfamily I DNA/RNA helicase